MSAVSKVQCDAPGCGKLQGEANHWIKIRGVLKDGALVYLTLGANDVGYDSSKLTKLDICSETCLNAVVAKVLAAFRDEESAREASVD